MLGNCPQLATANTKLDLLKIHGVGFTELVLVFQGVSHFCGKYASVSYLKAGPRCAVDSASDSRARGPGFDTRSGHILSFLPPLVQEGTGESMGTKYWLTA